MLKQSRLKLNRFWKLPLTKIFIIVLGYFVVFGLGFAFGLHYAQNLYFNDHHFKEKGIISRSHSDLIQNSFQEYSFIDELKKPIQSKLRKKNLNQKLNKTSEQKMSEQFNIKENFNDKTRGLKGSLDRYTIQIYSFKSKDICGKKISELREKGYDAYQSKIALRNNIIHYRVRIGHFETQAEAIKILKEIRTFENKDAFITRD